MRRASAKKKVFQPLHKPYMKPNNTPLYVHKQSKHPPNIIKNIPERINRRLSNVSSNEKLFKKAISPYQDALKKSGYDYKLEYKPTINQNNKSKNNRKRNITWFNPPYSKHVASNIGKQFLNLIETCFPPTNKLHKKLNRNTVKLSYRCMSNVKQIISNHNKTMLTKESSTENTANNCNCRVKEKCPVDKKCQTSSLIYQATVTRHDNNKDETYTELTGNTFKTRCNGHTNSFRHNNCRNSTALSNYIWIRK